MECFLAYLVSAIPRGSNTQAFVMEFILTVVLMLVVCGNSLHGKATKPFVALVVGFTVVAEAMFAGAITMASMNPARSIGPALVSGNTRLYIVANILGAIVARFVFVKCIKCKNSDEC